MAPPTSPKSQLQDSKKKAQELVPSYVTPRECFIWFRNNKEGYLPIPGTPCAHYVAHQLELKRKSRCCDQGYLIRVEDLVAQLTEISSKDVAVNDVWARLQGDTSASGKTEPTNHCGMVVAVTRKPDSTIESITIRHDSSGQRKLADNDWASYFKGGGKFYRKGSASSASPREMANADRLARGLPLKDHFRKPAG